MEATLTSSRTCPCLTRFIYYSIRLLGTQLKVYMSYSLPNWLLVISNPTSLFHFSATSNKPTINHAKILKDETDDKWSPILKVLVQAAFRFISQKICQWLLRLSEPCRRYWTSCERWKYSYSPYGNVNLNSTVHINHACFENHV